MSFSRMRRGSFAKTLKSIEPEYSDFVLDGGISAASKNQWFFEVAWEVANKGESQNSFGMTSGFQVLAGHPHLFPSSWFDLGSSD